MNSVHLTGRITKELELRHTPNDKPVCEFSLAVYRDKDNTDFINCVVWNNQAENLCKYQGKGSLIGLIGALRIDTYKDKDGNTRYKNYVLVNNIEYLSSKQETKEESVEEPQADPINDLGNSITVEQLDQMSITDDDLPF